jgi:hypothetical protein
MKLPPAASGRLRIFTRRLLCCHPLRGSGRLRRMSHRRSASASPHSPNATPSRRATGPPSLAATPVILLPRPRRRSVSFVGRDASQPPPPAPHVVPSVGFLLPRAGGPPPHATPTASLVRLHPTSHRRSTSSACSPLRAASLLLPTPHRRSGSSSPGAAVLLDARARSYRSDTGKRESSHGRAARPHLPSFPGSVTEAAGDQSSVLAC